MDPWVVTVCHINDSLLAKVDSANEMQLAGVSEILLLFMVCKGFDHLMMGRQSPIHRCLVCQSCRVRAILAFAKCVSRVFQRSGYLARDIKMLYDLTLHGLQVPFSVFGVCELCCTSRIVTKVLIFSHRIDVRNESLQSQNTFVREVMSIKYLRKLLDDCASGWA